jgi:hypothetical protein
MGKNHKQHLPNIQIPLTPNGSKAKQIRSRGIPRHNCATMPPYSKTTLSTPSTTVWKTMKQPHWKHLIALVCLPCVALSFFSLKAHASSLYLPEQLSPEIEARIERLFVMANMPRVKRPNTTPDWVLWQYG